MRPAWRERRHGRNGGEWMRELGKNQQMGCPSAGEEKLSVKFLPYGRAAHALSYSCKMCKASLTAGPARIAVRSPPVARHVLLHHDQPSSGPHVCHLLSLKASCPSSPGSLPTSTRVRGLSTRMWGASRPWVESKVQSPIARGSGWSPTSSPLPRRCEASQLCSPSTSSSLPTTDSPSSSSLPRGRPATMAASWVGDMALALPPRKVPGGCGRRVGTLGRLDWWLWRRWSGRGTHTRKGGCRNGGVRLHLCVWLRGSGGARGVGCGCRGGGRGGGGLE